MALQRAYELMIIVDSDVADIDIPKVITRTESLITDEGGSVASTDNWGRRKFAYEINHKAEGIYVVLDLTTTPESVAELDRQLNLNEAIVRTKVTRPVVSKAAAKADAALGG